MTLPTLAITAGEPAGIGPDLVLALATHTGPSHCVVIADRDLLHSRTRQLGLSITLRDYHPANQRAANTLDIIHVPLNTSSVPGKLDPANARYVLDTLDIAIKGCLQHTFSALVTAPVHKGIINDAGIPFTGHTEYLAERTHTRRVVMMLVGGGMRVALATTHIPLRHVATAITKENLAEIITILHHDLIQRFHIPTPRIGVAGLNPHAGEEGHLGREEIDTIAPVLIHLREKGMQLIGPLPADTLFNRDSLVHYDAILAMYHDQGLPVLKHACFGHGVNMTLGLPLLRTSVDHGTALPLAATGRADPGSFHAAVALAENIIQESRAPRQVDDLPNA